MFVLIGLLVVFGSVIGGYVMHQGHIGVLVQVSEFIIIGGAGFGALLVGNPLPLVKRVFRESFGLIRSNSFSDAAYAELLQVLYELFQTARRDGATGIEAHVEEPEKSALFAKYPHFSKNHDAVAFLCDTLKVLMTGTVEDHHLSEILEMDLERHHKEAMAVPHAINRIGDAMPGFGICAAVLGVIVTMGSIGGEASVIGEKVAAALVGTFLGVLLCYGVFGPIASALEGRIGAEEAYMEVIKVALLSFAREDSPMTSVEFARRAIEPADRPSFTELESLTRRKAA